VLVLDLDEFKAVNDGFGHAAGDELLVAIAAALRRRLRDGDVIARLGGDEFGVIVRRVNEPLARLLGEDLRATVREVARERGIAVSASVGVCALGVAGDPPRDGEQVVAGADAAMYAAKRRGRDRLAVQRFRPTTISV
jgi:diguanylate cyclase (GGDEF)-like protein